MNSVTQLQTPRLILRQWKIDDLAPFAVMNQDVRVMEYFVNTLTPEESQDFIDKVSSIIDKTGWGIWALELKESGEFIGFTGLHRPQYDFPFSPCVEIGWRLGYQYWGKGYASEAANASLEFGFESLMLDEIVSFTALPNKRSQAVMERLGMHRCDEDFDHPGVPQGHVLQRHCLYRLSRPQWRGLI